MGIIFSSLKKLSHFIPGKIGRKLQMALNTQIRIIHFIPGKIGRQLQEDDLREIVGTPSEKDRTYYTHPLPKGIDLWGYLHANFNNSNVRVIEIGSRHVVTKSPAQIHMPLASYTGFDIHPGENVDVVGDAHKLSEYFEPGSVDVVISIAVFEHLAMPWVVAEEIAKVLRPGGVACIFTHFSWSEHEQPWHFFQFNSKGLESLFNRCLGFETIASGLGMPMVGRFAFDCDADHAGKAIAHLYCSSYVVSKKIEDHDISGDKPFDWRSALSSVYDGTLYPAGTGRFAK